MYHSPLYLCTFSIFYCGNLYIAMLQIFHAALFACFTISMLYFFVYLFMLPFLYIALYSYCAISILYFFFSCSTFLCIFTRAMLHFYTLQWFCFAFFCCCIFSILQFFPGALCSCCVCSCCILQKELQPERPQTSTMKNFKTIIIKAVKYRSSVPGLRPATLYKGTLAKIFPC